MSTIEEVFVMKLKKVFLGTVLIPLILGGCSIQSGVTSHQVKQVKWMMRGGSLSIINNKQIPSGYSRIIFIRNNDNQRSVNIAIDGRFQTSLHKSSFSSILLCPKQYSIGLVKEKQKNNQLLIDSYSLNTKDGSIHYVLINPEGHEVSAQEISEDDVKKLLKEQVYLEQTHQISRVQRDQCSAAEIVVDKPIDLHIEFDFDKASIRSQYNQRIADVVAFMENNSTALLHLEGHTDNMGNASYNLILSNKRAEAVRQEFVSKYNIDASRITAKGYGETRPVATNSTKAGRQLNRRVDARIMIKN